MMRGDKEGGGQCRRRAYVPAPGRRAFPRVTQRRTGLSHTFPRTLLSFDFHLLLYAVVLFRPLLVLRLRLKSRIELGREFPQIFLSVIALQLPAPRQPTSLGKAASERLALSDTKKAKPQYSTFTELYLENESPPPPLWRRRLRWRRIPPW